MVCSRNNLEINKKQFLFSGDAVARRGEIGLSHRAKKILKMDFMVGWSNGIDKGRFRVVGKNSLRRDAYLYPIMTW